MTTLPKRTEETPDFAACWWQNSEGQVFVRCGNCLAPSLVSDRIDDAGRIAKPLVCRDEFCPFVDLVVLDGWTRTKQPGTL